MLSLQILAKPATISLFTCSSRGKPCKEHACCRAPGVMTPGQPSGSTGNNPPCSGLRGQCRFDLPPAQGFIVQQLLCQRREPGGVGFEQLSAMVVVLVDDTTNCLSHDLHGL